LRMDPTRGRPLTGERLDEWEERRWARILESLGEESSPPDRRAIRRHAGGADRRTRGSSPRWWAAPSRKAWPRDIHPATRTFQALRYRSYHSILSPLLSIRIVARGGGQRRSRSTRSRIASGEAGFAKLATGCILPAPAAGIALCGRRAVEVLTRKPVGGHEEESHRQSRARSARAPRVEGSHETAPSGSVRRNVERPGCATSSLLRCASSRRVTRASGSNGGRRHPPDTTRSTAEPHCAAACAPLLDRAADSSAPPRDAQAFFRDSSVLGGQARERVAPLRHRGPHPGVHRQGAADQRAGQRARDEVAQPATFTLRRTLPDGAVS